MPDGDENTIGVHLKSFAGLGVAQARARHSQRIIRAQHLIDFAVPQYLDLVMGKQALLQNFFTAQAVARCTKVTFEAKFVRNNASSTAVLPPPTTNTSLLR